MAAILSRLPAVRVGRFDVTSVVGETMREVSDDDVPGLAAETAYHSILTNAFGAIDVERTTSHRPGGGTVVSFRCAWPDPATLIAAADARLA